MERSKSLNQYGVVPLAAYLNTGVSSYTGIQLYEDPNLFYERNEEAKSFF